MKKIIYISFIFVFFQCVKYNTSSIKKADIVEKKLYSYDNFIININIIFEKVVDLTVYDDLYGIEEFIDIYENPKSYFHLLIKLAKEENICAEKKVIATLAMLRLEQKYIVKLLIEYCNLYNKGEIDEQLISVLILGDFNNKKIVIRNYKKQEIKKILIKIRNISHTSLKLKTTINDILSGKYD